MGNGEWAMGGEGPAFAIQRAAWVVRVGGVPHRMRWDVGVGM